MRQSHRRAFQFFLLTAVVLVLSSMNGLFASTPEIAVLTSPASGSTRVNTPCTFSWTAVAGAQAYYLWVGTSPGAKDVVHTSGGLPASSTSYTVKSLPHGQTLYATILTELAGVWWAGTSCAFTTAPEIAALTSPAGGATGVASPCTFRWTAVAGAEAYYLWVGTSPGAKDVVHTSGGLPAGSTSYTVKSLPYGQTLYATILTELAGVWWAGTSCAFTTAPEIAALTSPANGATRVGTSWTFQWTGVAAAQAYYLYVGTSPGAKDVVNTGGLPAGNTSYAAKNLPFGQKLYATIWTQLAGVWWPSASVFTTVPPIAVLTSPANGATKVSSSCTFQWSGVAAAQAYYLYVGTSPGAKDLVNTGEIQTTSYFAKNLPFSQTLYATIWTKLAGSWYSTNSTFTTAAQIAVLTSPADGATRVTSPCTFQWTGVAGAQSYYLWVGTSPGTKDVVNAGSLPVSSTSYTVKSLPWGQKLYAMIWTELGGVWYSSSSEFTTSLEIATLTAPAYGATGVTPPYVFQWTSVAGAQDYHFWVGTSPGAHDLIYIGGATLTSYSAASLPWSQKLYVTIWTELGGVWYSSSSSFTTSPPVASLTTPVNGSVGVDPDCVLRWTSVPGAQAYYLWVGTSPDTEDLVNTGSLPVSCTSYQTLSYPVGQTLYVTLLTEVGGVWYRSKTTFSTRSMPPVASPIPSGASTMTFPADGATNIDVSEPFQWTYADLTGEYWLTIGTAPGEYDVLNSGPIYVPRRIVQNLPLGTPLYGQLFLKSGGTWALADDFTFSAQSSQLTTDACIQSAFWATNYIRQMADINNVPVPGTLLTRFAVNHVYNGVVYASCGEYASTLLAVLDEMDLPLNTATLRVVFNPNAYAPDGHVIVEMFNPDQQSWMLLDPTFNLTAKRASDGAWATAEDIRTSTLNMTWGQIEYVFLGSEGDIHARNYYIDYPLLYLNVYHEGMPIIPAEGPSVLPYYIRVPVPITGSDIYAIRNTEQYSVTYLDSVGGNKLYTVACDGVDSFSALFYAKSVAVPDGGSSFELYIPNWYVF